MMLLAITSTDNVCNFEGLLQNSTCVCRLLVYRGVHHASEHHCTRDVMHTAGGVHCRTLNFPAKVPNTTQKSALAMASKETGDDGNKPLDEVRHTAQIPHCHCAVAPSLHR